MKNYGDLGGRYPPRLTTSADKGLIYDIWYDWAEFTVFNTETIQKTEDKFMGNLIKKQRVAYKKWKVYSKTMTYWDYILKRNPMFLFAGRQEKWNDSFETWTDLWLSQKTIARTEENTDSFVLQRLTTFRQTGSNIIVLWPLITKFRCVYSWLTVKTPYLHHIAAILLAKNTSCVVLST